MKIPRSVRSVFFVSWKVAATWAHLQPGWGLTLKLAVPHHQLVCCGEEQVDNDNPKYPLLSDHGIHVMQEQYVVILNPCTCQKT